jgi:hypothetical protein
MIANISPPSSSVRGALNYNYEKLEAGEAQVLQVNKIWRKYSGGEFTANELAYIFEERAAINKNTKNPFIHISLNPHPDDVLTDEQLSKIAEEYLKKMEFGNQPYIIFKHEDIDRHHLHIVTTNIKEDGSKICDSNNHYRSKKITEELEKKYSLHLATKQKGEGIWRPEKVDASKKVTPQIRNIVKHLTDTYRFHSINEYRSLLSLYNVDVQEVKGEAAGNLYEGILYSALDEGGNRTTNPVKSSMLGKFAGGKNLEKIYKKTAGKPLSNASVNRIKDDLSSAMQSATSESDLIRLTKEKDIDLLLRKNDDGRIYGATIVDHRSKTVLKGSHLGKEFSANAFHSLLGQSHLERQQMQEVESQDMREVQEEYEPQEEAQALREDAQEERYTEGIAEGFGWMPEQEQKQAQEYTQQPRELSLGGMGSLFNAVGGATKKYAPPKKRKKKKERDLSI